MEKELKRLSAVLLSVAFLLSYGFASDKNISLLFSKPVEAKKLSDKELKETKGSFISVLIADLYYYTENKDEDFSYTKLGEITVHETLYTLTPNKGWKYYNGRLYFYTSGTYTPVFEVSVKLTELYDPSEWQNLFEVTKESAESSGSDTGATDIETYYRFVDPVVIANDIGKILDESKKFFERALKF